MKKITVIAALVVAFALAANAEAQTYGNMPVAGATIYSGQSYPDNGYTVSAGQLTVQPANGTLASGTLGGVRLSGGTVANSGTINILDWMTGGTFTNNGTVGNFGANGITGGTFTNNGTANGTVTLSGDGKFVNNGTTAVATATVGGNGEFTNNAGKTVTALTQNGGTFTNSGIVSAINGFTAGTFTNNGTVEGITNGITGGTFNNNGTINGSVVFSGTAFTNYAGKTVGTLTQNGSGTVTNNGTVTTLTQNSGTVINNFRLDTLNYADGTYDKGTGGSIGTLNASGNVTGTDWGTVTNLNLNGGSLDLNIGAGLNLTGWVGTVANVVDLDGAIVKFTLGMLEADFWAFLDNVKANDPDAGLFDTTIIRPFDLLQELFGTAAIENRDKATYLFTDFQDGVWDDSFYAGLTFDGGIFTLEWKTGSDPNALPEPATLAIFGLGLVGLGVARARRRK